MINEERGLEVSDMKTLIQTVMITTKYLMAKKLGVMWKQKADIMNIRVELLGPGVSQTAIYVL